MNPTAATCRSLRRVRRRQLEADTPIVALAVARQVVEEAEQWLEVALPARYAAGLAHRARRVYAHSELYRPRFAAGGDAGRDRLYAFMRHWLAARLQEERAELFGRLPRGFARGEPAKLQAPSSKLQGSTNRKRAEKAEGDDGWLSPECRLIAAW